MWFALDAHLVQVDWRLVHAVLGSLTQREHPLQYTTQPVSGAGADISNSWVQVRRDKSGGVRQMQRQLESAVKGNSWIRFQAVELTGCRA